MKFIIWFCEVEGQVCSPCCRVGRERELEDSNGQKGWELGESGVLCQTPKARATRRDDRTRRSRHTGNRSGEMCKCQSWISRNVILTKEDKLASVRIEFGPLAKLA